MAVGGCKILDSMQVTIYRAVSPEKLHGQQYVKFISYLQLKEMHLIGYKSRNKIGHRTTNNFAV